jgi:rare lipoprotein A (peptidoglycan hydrolase)
MLNKDHMHGCASTLTLVGLLFFAGQGRLEAQTHSPSTSQFETIFKSPGRVDPTFTRPDVTRGLPSLPSHRDESAPDLQAQGASESPKKKGVLSTLKKAIVPSAKAHTAPKQPRKEARPSASEPSTTAAVPAGRKQSAAAKRRSDRARIGVRRPNPAKVGSRTSRAIKVTRADRTGAQRGLQAARPTVSRRAHLSGGRAVWYQHPGRTASGEKFNPNAPTAAHKTLPLGTRVRVVNKQNRRSVVVRVNDRMPAKAKGAIDLSRASARAIGITGVGSVAVHRTHGASGASARQHIRPKRPPALPIAMRRDQSVETAGSISARPRLRPTPRPVSTPVAPFALPETLQPRDLW